MIHTNIQSAVRNLGKFSTLNRVFRIINPTMLIYMALMATTLNTDFALCGLVSGYRFSYEI